jgi:hypothetical protein
MQSFTRYGGIIQLVLGLLGQFVPSIGAMLGASSGGNIINILSGAALSYLSTQQNAATQQTGARVLGIVNALVGILGFLGMTSIAGIPLNPGTLANLVSLGIGAWGLVSGFTKRGA